MECREARGTGCSLDFHHPLAYPAASNGRRGSGAEGRLPRAESGFPSPGELIFPVPFPGQVFSLHLLLYPEHCEEWAVGFLGLESPQPLTLFSTLQTDAGS